MKRWKRCTVTIINADGKPFSVPAYASSAFDAAHQYILHVQEQGVRSGLPTFTPETVICVQFQGRPTSERVEWRALQAWIEKQNPERGESSRENALPGSSLQ
jgi:hypothetical protein